MAMRDSRFGQFADPGFGASLSHSSTGDPGVLPTPDQSGPSASTVQSAAPAAPQQPSYSPMQLGPGLLGQNGSNRGSMFLAEGGVIPDGQDSGDAAPATPDPFGMIQQALSYGRKKLGLPETFFGPAKPKSSNDAAATNQAAKDEGATGNLQDDDLRAFQNNQINNNLQPGEQGQWGDTTLEGKDKTAYLAEGGSIEDDTGTDDDQGVIPDGNDDQSQDQGQQRQDPMGQGGYPDVIGKPQQADPQAIMSYLKGEGAVTPDIAAGLERQVDPQGRMPDSLRKMLAVSQAGSPDKAFQVLQHYRQKFNAYSTFARAALQGAGGRPPNPGAAADALNKAYAHVPDGADMHFQPLPNGEVQVAMRKIIPSKPAPSGGEDNTQRDQPTQSFAEGGSVDDDFQYETAGSETPSGSSYDRSRQADAAQDDSADDWETRKQRRAAAVKGFGDKIGGVIGDALTPTEGEAEGYKQIGGALGAGGKAVGDAAKEFWNRPDTEQSTKTIKMKWNDLMKWVTGDGQFDARTDKQDDGLPQPSPEGQAVPGPGPDQGPQQTNQGVTSQRPQQPLAANPLGGVNQREQSIDNPSAGGKPPPTSNPVAFGRYVGQQAKAAGATYNDVKYHIGRAYQSVGQSQQYELAMAAAANADLGRQADIEKEQTKGESANERARITGGYGVQKAQVASEVRQVAETMRNDRQIRGLLAKAAEAAANRDAKTHQAVIQQIGATARTMLGNMATPEAVEQTIKELQAQGIVPQQDEPQRRPAPQQQATGTGTGQQPSPTDIAYLKANPNVASKFDARFGAGASQRVLGQ